MQPLRQQIYVIFFNIPQESVETLEVPVFKGLRFCHWSLVASSGFSARILHAYLNYPIRATYPANFILCF
jgi:hypothetical protein